MQAVSEKKARPVRASNTRKKAKVEPQRVDQQGQKKLKITRGKRGILANLPDLPLDVLFEILAHLGPYDLLKLARTSKEYRRLLLNRICVSVWKAALASVPGLPPCPDDMSEPAYANLAFSPHCASCLTHSKNVTWRLRVRYCNKCEVAKLSTVYPREYRMSAIYFRQTRDMTDKFDDLDLPNLVPCVNKKGDKWIAQSDINEFVEKYFDTPEARRSLFIKERKKYIEERYKHAALCQKWSTNQVMDRTIELQTMRDERRAAIIEKLEELGLGDEVQSIKFPDSLAAHKLVDKPQRLTPRIWANIKPTIMEFMTLMREKRLKRELSDVLYRRKLLFMDVLADFKRKSHDTDAIMPSPADICEIPAIREILHQPIDIPVDRQSCDEVVSQFPTLVDVWQTSLRASLHDLIKKADPDADAASALVRAATVFVCSACYEDDDHTSEIFPLFYPQVQGHRCLSREALSWDEDIVHPEDPSLRFAYPLYRRIPWNPAPLTLSTRAGAVARALIQSVGLDPEIATVSDMEALELRFYCQACPQGSGNLMTWRAAVKHLCDMHSLRLDSVDKAIKKFRLEDIPEPIVSAERGRLHRSNIWECLACRDTLNETRLMSEADVRDHLKTGHSKDAPIEQEDYSKHFAALDRLTSRMRLRVRCTGGNLELSLSMYNGLSTSDSKPEVDDTDADTDFMDEFN